MKDKAVRIIVPLVLGFFLYPFLSRVVTLPPVIAYAVVAGLIMLVWP